MPVLRVQMGKLLLVGLVLASEPARRTFNVPADDAVVSLKLFAEQAGQEIIYPADSVKGVKTNAVKGDFTARDALDQLVAATDLVVGEYLRHAEVSVSGTALVTVSSAEGRYRLNNVPSGEVSSGTRVIPWPTHGSRYHRAARSRAISKCRVRPCRGAAVS